MHLLESQDRAITTIAKQLRGLTSKILEGLEPDGETVHLASSSDLLANQAATRLFLLKAGRVHCEVDRKLIYLAEPGDLLGLARSLQLPEGPYRSDGPLELVPYPRDRLIKHVNQSEALQKHWALYLLTLAAFFRECLVHETPGQFKPATGFLHFETGDVIIQQGDQAECVYTLLEGSADAIHNDVKVGEIHADEIFGAMAVFTGQKRNATVKATSSCSVLAVRKDEFLNLAKHQPQISLSLIEEMAQKINQLNAQVLKLQKQ